MVQVSRLLGHENLEVTMRYLDISLEMEAKALEAVQSEDDMTIKPKWKNDNESLKAICGIYP